MVVIRCACGCASALPTTGRTSTSTLSCTVCASASPDIYETCPPSLTISSHWVALEYDRRH
eukprot:scaffold622208_cov24-Prasinocladus_malaysianus.AAC.1